MTPTVHHSTRNTHAMELSISDLKAPIRMEDSSSQTASTADESFQHQSFDFLNRSMLVKPLADTSETSTGGFMKDPSIAELQSVFASQARIRTTTPSPYLSDNSRTQLLLSDNSRVSLGDRLEKRWNNHSSLQESFSTMDSSATSAARAGSPVLPKPGGEVLSGDGGDEEEEEELFQMPVICISSAKNNKQPMNDGSTDESLLDFESVCFEPEVASSPEVEDKTRRSSRRRASGTKTNSSSNKYSGLGNLASYGSAALGKKKALLADIAATAGKRNKTKRSTSMRNSSKRGTKSRSSSPTTPQRRESTGGARRSKRSERPSTRRASRKIREDSPPPLVDSPRDREQQQTVRRTRTSENHHKSESRNSLRRTKTDSFSSGKRSGNNKDPEQVRRVKSSDYTPRPSASSSGKSHRTKPRRTKSGDDLPMPNLSGRRKAAHQGRIAPTFEQVAMDIDLDDITASQHSPDYYYLDDTTAGEDSKSNLRSYQDSVRSNLMEEMVQAVQAKDETKAKRGSVMENLLSMLLEEIGSSSSSDPKKPINPRSKPPTKPRRVRSGTMLNRRETTMNASQSSGTTSSNSNSSSARASTSRRRKPSKE